MKSLILIAHGSRRASSNAEVRSLAEQLAHRTASRFPHVTCAFLEFAEPSIPAAIDAAVRARSDEIVILPYFLAGGTHVKEDIPAIINAKRKQHSAVRIELKPHVGAAPDMLELLAAAI